MLDAVVIGPRRGGIILLAIIFTFLLFRPSQKSLISPLFLRVGRLDGPNLFFFTSSWCCGISRQEDWSANSFFCNCYVLIGGKLKFFILFIYCDLAILICSKIRFPFKQIEKWIFIMKTIFSSPPLNKGFPLEGMRGPQLTVPWLTGGAPPPGAWRLPKVPVQPTLSGEVVSCQMGRYRGNTLGVELFVCLCMCMHFCLYTFMYKIHVKRVSK